MAPSRIDELRRRVQSDPASIAFAQLAEEYRRSGQTEEAVRVCREGLTRHPGYLSARVTLGRALLDLGQLDAARDELEFVVAEAPENLAAVRGLAEIFHREGQTTEALSYYQRALALARHDPEIEEIVQQLSRQVGAAAASPGSGLSFEEAHQELLSAAERLPVSPPQDPPTMTDRNAAEGSTAPFDFDRLVAALGSPAAPPQVETAVAGIASTPVISFPEVPSLGADPFAALEAELRASEAAPRIAPWSGPDSDPVEAPDGRQDANAAWTDGAGEAISAAEVLADTLLSDPDDMAAADSASAADAVAAEAEAEPQDTSGSAPAGAAAPAEDMPPAEPPPAAASEGVLDELEGWLTTLQDRSSR